MSKSFDFCKATAQNTYRSSYADRSWDNAVEDYETEAIFDKYLHGARNFSLRERLMMKPKSVLMLVFLLTTMQISSISYLKVVFTMVRCILSERQWTSVFGRYAWLKPTIKIPEHRSLEIVFNTLSGASLS